MSKNNVPSAAAAVADEVAAAVNDVAQDPGTDLRPAEAPAVADSIIDRLWPIILNLTNGEPWYRSRVLLGLLTAGIGWLIGVLNQIGWISWQIDAFQAGEAASTVIEIVGLVIAAIGRLRPARPPIGGGT